MYLVVQRYRGASQLFDELVRQRTEEEQMIRGVPGFVACYLVRAGDGGTSITVCEDRAGTEEATRRAADWVQQNVPAAAENRPEVTEGEVLYQFGK
jgi:hypothetical protein